MAMDAALALLAVVGAVSTLGLTLAIVAAGVGLLGSSHPPQAPNDPAFLA